MASDLEAPGSDDVPDWDSLYRAREGEVAELRPIFTGDVFADVEVGQDEVKIVQILQHPCAIRRGPKLIEKLLVAEVAPSQLLKPSAWARQAYKQLPLARLRPNSSPADFAASFVDLHLVASEQLVSSMRIASLSQKGVNLLLQRWVHHNSRAVIPTKLFQEVTAAPFEEADLIEDWCVDRVADGVDAILAAKEVEDWLSEAEGGISRRARLLDDQARSELRRSMRTAIRELG